jgi:DNA polymerase I-like protein with 3'-5' exonuclease and polymerase domains
MNPIYITNTKELDDVYEDLHEYKKLFFDDKATKGKARIALDKETKFTDICYKEHMEYYTDRGDAIPQCYRTSDDDWEGVPRLIQIGMDPVDKKVDRQYLIDTDYITAEQFTSRFKDFLENQSIIIGQNIKYDLSFLCLQYGIFPKEIRCTQLISILRNNGDNFLNDNSQVLHRLDALYARYIPLDVFIRLTGMTHKEYHKFKKENQLSDWSVKHLDPNQLKYAAQDVELIFYLFHYMMKDCQEFVKRNPKSQLAKNIKKESDFTLEAALMQSVGIGYDSDYQKNYVVPYLEKKLESAENELTKYPELWLEYSELRCPKKNPHTISLSHFIFTDKKDLLKKPPRITKVYSRDNLADVLMNSLGFELPKTAKGGDSVKDEVISDLFWKAEDGSRQKEILKSILNYNKAHTFLSKNGENQLKFVHSDGRCHPQYKQHAAETARLAAVKPAVMTIPKHDKLWRDPILDDLGRPVLDKKGNAKLMNAFYLFGRAYVSRDGYIIIDGDFSNEEVRVIGEYTGDREIIRAFQKELDLHQITADNLGVDRNTGKLFFLASMYGAYERRIRESIYDGSDGDIELPLEVVRDLRIKHFEHYSGLKAAIDECEAYVLKVMDPYPSLTSFTNRRPLITEITKYFGAHRMWCLNQNQERWAHKIKDEGRYDFLHRSHKILNEDTGKESTWNNEWNKTVRAIVRELFNYRIQTECSYILKSAVVNINRRFRAEGFDPLTEGVILTCHDEIATEVKEKHAQKAREIQEYCMLEALSLVLNKVPAKVEIGMGCNLYEAHP